jgi:quercetin dioxygenase-like cupin family protein
METKQARRSWTAVALVVTLAGLTLGWPAGARPTPASSGFSGTTFASGRFEAIDVVNHLAFARSEWPDAVEHHWLSMQKTTGPSDVYVQNNQWLEGASTGWHTHPGHSLIIVTEGTIAAYDHDCTRRVYVAGDTLVDAGGDHVHVLRNEGTGIARTVAIQIVPAGVARRIDAKAPESCPVL